MKIKALLLITSCSLLPLSSYSYETIDAWDLVYEVDAQPDNQVYWSPTKAGAPKVEAERGLLHLDTTSSLSNKLSFSHSWDINNATGLIVEAKLKLQAFTGDTGLGGVGIYVADDVREEALIVRPKGILLYNSNLAYNWGTNEKSADYHVYRIETEGTDIRVYVDGILRIEGIGRFGAGDNLFTNQVSFGDYSAGAGSRSTWDYIKYKINL